MLFTALFSTLFFVATTLATPATHPRQLAADAPLHALIADSFSGSFPGIVKVDIAGFPPNIKDATSNRVRRCFATRQCKRCDACTLCDDWKPGCCKRISPVCGSAEADTSLAAADPHAKPLCTYCSSKACFQIECQAGDAAGDIVDDAGKVPVGDARTAETTYDLGFVLDGPVGRDGECQPKDLSCAEGVCWIRPC